jgi:hypothetical protein
VGGADVEDSLSLGVRVVGSGRGVDAGVGDIDVSWPGGRCVGFSPLLLGAVTPVIHGKFDVSGLCHGLLPDGAGTPVIHPLGPVGVDFQYSGGKRPVNDGTSG